MTEITTIEMARDDMKFTAGHFTIFSATERERLHGHNFFVKAEITASVQDHGMAFNYTTYRKHILDLCRSLNEHFLLPTQSKFLSIEEDDTYYIATFNEQKMPFLKSDVLLLPLRNITGEELARWFVEQLSQDIQQIKDYGISEIVIRVSTGHGMAASASFTNLSP